VLAHDKFQGQFLLNLEISSQDRNDPKSCTQQFLMLIESFPDAARALWDGCTSRTFSYGFRGGCDYPALDTTITANLLLRIARLGGDIGITVYPYRSDEGSSDRMGSNGPEDLRHCKERSRRSDLRACITRLAIAMGDRRLFFM
jgi:hypothetical protein